MARSQIINNNANDNKSILEYEKKMILKTVEELKKLELKIAELENIQ